jgi:TolB-like protein/Flp pilus assembly protein TadD
VLPIVFRGDEAELEILAEDLTEEVTRELARNQFCRVIAAGTMAGWRGKPVDYRTTGRGLDARYLVEGKLQLVAGNIRLTVQLIDVSTASSVWSHRYSVPASQLADQADQFAVGVASELGERIHQSEMKRALASPGPYSAWDHVLRAMALTAHLGVEGTIKTEGEARLAVAAAPDLGFAHAMLAVGLAAQVLEGVKELDESPIQEIQEHAKRAMQLDPDNAMMIAWLVMTYCVLGDGETALRLARRAAELNPNSPTPYLVSGLACFELGRTADAIDAFLQADHIASLDPGRYLGLTHTGICHMLEGRHGDAEAAIDRSLALHPDYHLTLKWKALLSADRGDEMAALRAMRRLREAEPLMTIDHHVRQIERNRNIAARSAKQVATLRRLWAATAAEA